MTFIGRQKELKKLNEMYELPNSQIAVLYGRRRIGKSFLVKKFCQHKKSLVFEALERESLSDQLENFTEQLKKQIQNPLLKQAHFKKWEDIFNFLTDYFKTAAKKEKLVFFIDEFPWMASSQNRLVSLIKYYWDNEWNDKNIFLILCGSISSFMVRNVIRSKALYGRINLEMKVEKMDLSEAQLFFQKKRSPDEILKYMMIFGGVPKYLEEIDLKKSFQQNMQKLCFDKNGFFVNEFDKIFYSHFRENKTYRQIVELLSHGPADLKMIGQKLKIKSGGGLKGYLDNLASAGFIADYLPYNKESNSKLKKYKLQDEYTLFYFKYILPFKNSIQKMDENKIFTKKILLIWESWLGLAFENFCIQNAHYLSKIMGFDEEVESFGPYFERGQSGFQIDLLYKRFDHVITLCEMKYYNKPVDVKIIKEVEKKVSLLQIPRGYTLEKILIAPQGCDNNVEQLEYFHQVLNLKTLFK